VGLDPVKLQEAEAMLAKERSAAEKWKAQVWIEITRTIDAGKLEDLDAVIQEVTDAGLQNFMNGKAQRQASIPAQSNYCCGSVLLPALGIPNTSIEKKSCARVQ